MNLFLLKNNKKTLIAAVSLQRYHFMKRSSIKRFSRKQLVRLCEDYRFALYFFKKNISIAPLCRDFESFLVQNHRIKIF